MQVHVALHDITNIPVDAIVNPANSLGIMGGGVGGAIRRHGGDQIQSEAMKCAPIAIGAAVVTSAGQLPARHVIHAPTMEEPGLRVSAENVRRAARAALIAAHANQFEVIAIPGMGTDTAGGVPYDEAARSIVEEIRAHKKPFPATVWLLDSNPEMVAAFDEAMRSAQQGL